MLLQSYPGSHVYKKGANGGATNAATITMTARFLGKRSAALYVGVIPLCAPGAGILLDWLYFRQGISATATLGSAKNCFLKVLKSVLQFFCSL